MSYDEIQKIMFGQEDEVETEDKSEPERKPEKKAEEHKEEKKSEPEPAKTKCPHGFKFGEADKHKECKQCDPKLWDACVEG
jgi:hypothetical protein